MTDADRAQLAILLFMLLLFSIIMLISSWLVLYSLQHLLHTGTNREMHSCMQASFTEIELGLCCYNTQAFNSMADSICSLGSLGYSRDNDQHH